MGILKSIKANTKTVSFRLPAEVVDDLDKVKKEAQAKGLALDLTESVERMIIGAVRQARTELADAGSAGAAAGE